MKAESLVIPDQHAGVNTFPALYTPPVTPRKFVVPEVVDANRKEADAHGMTDDWGEVVTR